jgi:hypothetical protein
VPTVCGSLLGLQVVVLSLEMQFFFVQYLGDVSPGEPMVCGFRSDAEMVDGRVGVVLQGNNPQQCLDLRREPPLEGAQVDPGEGAVRVAVANAPAAHLQPLSATGQALCRPFRLGAASRWKTGAPPGEATGEATVEAGKLVVSLQALPCMLGCPAVPSPAALRLIVRQTLPK